MASAVLRWFVRVTVFGALVVPTRVLANARLLGVTVTGAIPTPARATDCWLKEELLLTVSVAMRLPRPDGVKVTGIVLACLG
jgi:hypothetical protein